MAYDSEKLKQVETEVIGKESHISDKYYEVKTSKGTFVVTEEHPFLTTRGWMFAKDLTSQDELVHIPGNLLNSFRMSNYNPMKDPEVVMKVHSHPNYTNWSTNQESLEKTQQTKLEKYGSLDPRVNFKEPVEEFHKRASFRMKRDNPMFNVEVVEKSIKGRKNLGFRFKGGMSRVEKKFWNWIQEDSQLKDLFWFTGDGGFTVRYDGKVKVPDFKLHGSNLFLEVGEETLGDGGFRPDWNKYKKEINDIYAKSKLPDTKVLALNVAEGRENVLNKVKRFITNGIEILGVKEFDNVKEFKAVNIHCAPFDNYLINTPDSSCESIISHNCYFGEGGWCDSWYTSIHPEKGKINFNDIVEIYDRNPQISEMMLTGGSPTMHAALVNELTHFCQERGIFLTIETEGSHFVETDYPIDLLSISPKFSNSIPVVGELTPKGAVVTEKMVKQHNKFRLNKSTIMKMMACHSDFHIKPVVNPDEMPKVWKEVETFLQEIDCPKEKVYIMPPGDTREELIRVYPMVMEFCIKSGYGFTGRPHIIGYDTQREV